MNSAVIFTNSLKYNNKASLSFVRETVAMALRFARETVRSCFARETVLSCFARKTALICVARDTALACFARETALICFARETGLPRPLHAASSREQS